MAASVAERLAAAATALEMTEAELRTALDGAKTLPQVAQDKSVPSPLWSRRTRRTSP